MWYPHNLIIVWSDADMEYNVLLNVICLCGGKAHTIYLYKQPDKTYILATHKSTRYMQPISYPCVVGMQRSFGTRTLFVCLMHFGAKHILIMQESERESHREKKNRCNQNKANATSAFAYFE